MNLTSKNIVNLSIFASINALYILLYIFNQTFLQVICTLCILLLLLSGLLVFLQVHKMSDYKETDKLEIVSKEIIESCIMFIYEFINDKLTLVRKYLLWTNRMENVTVIIVIYSVGNFLSFVNFSVLFYLVTWTIFLYNHINSVYITKICELAHPYYIDLRDQAKYMFDNIPKLKHIKKTI
ncbi:hypothetical protein C922_01127 [Plasmodium inui San Antonio 1]|uniref:Reticulon domain-containing protein n=1 Tax=Plasmodium inui San Antonio 1 TaxID=1237626 RepID=W7A6G8_9APIC|nr:hypothetical protein C922_01127 [Plasmodium inui San Antonio 1]EUD68727.1 hypothetical protein C922_01127 [Plasmodium inui San Antonio 1]